MASTKEEQRYWTTYELGRNLPPACAECDQYFAIQQGIIYAPLAGAAYHLLCAPSGMNLAAVSAADFYRIRD